MIKKTPKIRRTIFKIGHMLVSLIIFINKNFNGWKHVQIYNKDSKNKYLVSHQRKNQKECGGRELFFCCFFKTTKITLDHAYNGTD